MHEPNAVFSTSAPEHTSAVALVTGASSGIGYATASRLRARGMMVFGTSRTGKVGPPGVTMLALDVDHDESVRRCIDALLERAGHLDVVVNNAGRAMVGACEETSAEEARALFETNVFGVMRVISAVLPSMREQRRGAIINVGSLSGSVAVPFHGVYSASKHALAGYSEALRLELLPFGIYVSLLEPEAHRTHIQMVNPRVPQVHYDRARKHVESKIRQDIEAGESPERVVDVIVAAATTDAPQFRYRVGRRAHAAIWARRLLPAALFEWVVQREFRLPG